MARRSAASVGERDTCWLMNRPPDAEWLVRRGALLQPERGRSPEDTIHARASVVNGGKHRLHVLREPRRGLRQRIETAELVGCEGHVERSDVVLELGQPPRADDRR